MKESTSQVKYTPFIVGAGAAFLLVLTILLGFIAPRVQAADKPGTITTADNRQDGITINLFDYSGYDGSNDASKYYLDEYPKEVSAGDLGCQLKKNDDSSTNWQTRGIHSKSGINCNYNTGDFRRFLFSSSGKGGTTLNNSSGNAPRTGIVQNRLGSDGYPVLTKNDTLRTNGESLNYLFNNDTANAKIYGKTIYHNVTNLMTKDKNGTYRYDSNQNYAYYNPSQGDNGSFEVYNGTFKNDEGAIVGFFPFDDYDATKTNTFNYAKPIEKRYDHHFGMTMSAQFSLAQNGKLDDGQDAAFDYSGDDDMWLFIDDVLVLDLGGIHNAQHGQINFTTGQVQTYPVNNASNTTTTTLDQIFKAQGVNWENNKPHSLKMFYLERGGYLSNLAMTLNIPITRTVNVTKKVDGTTADDYLNQDFHYKAEIQRPNSTTWEPYTGRKVIDGVTSNITDGTFTLKPTQTAQLLDIQSTWKYRVIETGVSGQDFDKVAISGSDTKSQSLTDGQTADVSSSSLSASSLTNALTFTNHIREAYKPLTVTKVWADNSNANGAISSVKFQVIQTAHHADGSTSDTVWKDADGNTDFTAEASKNWQHTFSNMLVRSGSTTYTYQVKEVETPAGYTTSYTKSDNGSSLDVTITNKKINALPNTGGSGISKWLLAGGLLMLIAFSWAATRKQLYKK
jgi:fibro-slime domain-containing protein/LPXTG-motif cell wall-anchored protein